MENIVYVQATANPKDIEVLMDFRITFLTELVGNAEAKMEQQLRTQLETYFKTELNVSCLAWYATIENTPIAVAMMVLRNQLGGFKNISGKWGYVMNVYTHPIHRKKGISTQLLRNITEHAQRLGVEALELHATQEGESLYVKEGFVLHKEPSYRKIIQTK